MAISLDSVTNGEAAAGGAGSTLTIAHTCASGVTILIVEIAVNDSNQHAHQTTNVTYNGVSLTNLIVEDSGGNTRVEIWYLISPPTGSSYNVVVSYNFLNYVGAGILSFLGTSTSVPTQSQGSYGTASSVGMSETPTFGNSWLLDVISDQTNPTTITTLQWSNQNQSYQQGRGSSVGPVSVATSMGYTNLSNWSYAQMVLAPASGISTSTSTTTTSTSTTTTSTSTTQTTSSTSTTTTLVPTGTVITPVVIQNSITYDPGASGQAFTHTISNFACYGINSLLVVVVFERNATNEVTGVTANGANMPLQAQSVNPTNCGVQIYTLINPASNETIVISTNANSLASAIVLCLSNVSQTTPVEAFITGSAFGATPQASITTLTNNAFVLAALNTTNAQTVTPITGVTIDQNFKPAAANLGQEADAFISNAMPGSIATGFTIGTADNWVLAVVSIRSATVASVTPQNIPRGLSLSGLEFPGQIPGTLNTSFFESAQTTVNYFVNKGWDLIRLPFLWERLQPTLNGVLDPTYKSYIDGMIAEAATVGAKVLLDCHNYGRRIITPASGGITEGFTEAVTSLSYPYATYTQSGYIILRNYGEALLGTFINPISPATGYNISFNMTFNSRDNTFGGEGFMIRPMWQSDTNCYQFDADYADQTWNLSTIINGTTTTLASGSYTWILGTKYAIAIDVNQATNGYINISIAGTPLFTTNSIASNATILTGKVAFFPNGMHVQMDTLVLNINSDISSGEVNQYVIGSTQVPNSALANLWSQIAQAYAGNQNVIGYDVMNEPHDMLVPTNTSNYNSTASVTLMVQACINAIRNYDTTHYIICELDEWAGGQNFVSQYGSNPTPWWTDNANKLVYSFHYYFDNDHSGSYQNDSTNSATFASSNNTRISGDVTPIMSWAQSNNLLLLAGEYGVPSVGAWQICLTTFLALCNQYTVWASYWAAGDAYSSLTSIQPDGITPNFTDALPMAIITSQVNLGISPSVPPTGGGSGGIPTSAIISFDIMKWTKDTMANQPNATALQNLLSVMQANFPGVTHVAISPLMNTTAAFEATGITPNPLTAEAFVDLILETVHSAGYNVILRCSDGTMEGTYNFTQTSQTVSYWLTNATNFLTTHAANIRNGDIIALYPEADGFINYSGTVASPIDNGSHNYRADYNQFWQQMPTTIASWASANGKTVTTRTTVNGTTIANPSYNGTNFNTSGMDQFENITSLTAEGGIIIDWYNFSNAPTDETDYIAWYKASLNFFYSLYTAGTYDIFIQEWGDTRGLNNGSIQASDPALTGNMADQVFFPLLKSGQLLGINFWDFFDTPQEGILNAGGDSVSYINAGGAITLNPKGQYLAQIFQKWLGATTTSTSTSSSTTTTSTSTTSSTTTTISTSTTHTTTSTSTTHTTTSTTSSTSSSSSTSTTTTSTSTTMTSTSTTISITTSTSTSSSTSSSTTITLEISFRVDNGPPQQSIYILN